MTKQPRQTLRQRFPTPQDRLFIGKYPEGLVYADRAREENGDYKRCAFIPYNSLVIEWAKDCPTELRPLIDRDHDRLSKMIGEQYQISSSGQTVTLGSDYLPLSGEMLASKICGQFRERWERYHNSQHGEHPAIWLREHLKEAGYLGAALIGARLAQTFHGTDLQGVIGPMLANFNHYKKGSETNG